MGAILRFLGIAVYFLGGLWGLFLCLGIVNAKAGFIGLVVAFFVLPVTLYVAPFYSGFADGDWFPLMVIYGSSIVGIVLFGLSKPKSDA